MINLISIVSKVMFRKRYISTTDPDRKERFQNHINSLSLLDFFIHHASCHRMTQIREYFGSRYIRGKGIEIGGGGHPLKVDVQKAKVLYVDRKTAGESYAIVGPNHHFVHVDRQIRFKLCQPNLSIL